MKKIQVLSITALISVLSLAGCGKRPAKDGEEEDSSKAQLTISTFEGGVGDKWLKNAAKEFEEKNKDRTDFEEGKVGVQIHVTSDRNGSGKTLEYAELNKDIYFTENVDYYGLTNKNKLADITDILTTPNAEDDNKKIVDKIDENLLDYLNRNDKYYAVPFYDCFYGLVYDKDLFEQKSFYMKDDGTFTNQRSQFGTGPNGVAGDWDDGLPKTYEQFASMMNRMRTMKVTPFTYSNSIATWYTTRALCSWWSDDEGYDEANLCYNFNGTAHHIVDSVDAEGNITYMDDDGNPSNGYSVEINHDKGYLLKRQAGVYNALHFARDILCDNTDNYRSYASNYDVQSAFVVNKYMGGSNKPIAMMFEGTWWENEAAGAIEEAESYGAESFNYGLMPIPKSSDEKVGEGATFLNLNDSYGFIAANSSHMKLAKEFFSFVHTDAQMRAFTLETNMTRGLAYKFNEEDKDKVSGYASDLMAIKESEHAKILYPVSGLDFFVNNGEFFDSTNWLWDTKTLSNQPIIKFIDSKSLSAKSFFDEHISMVDESSWSRLVK